MNIFIKGAVIVAAVAAVAGCAASGAANSSAAASSNKPARPSPSAQEASLRITAYGRPSAAQKKRKRSVAQAAATKNIGDYKRVTKDGVDYFCRKEKVTGSRATTIEQCLTEAQMTAMREDGQSLLRDVQRNPGNMPMPDSSGNYSELGNPNTPR